MTASSQFLPLLSRPLFMQTRLLRSTSAKALVLVYRKKLLSTRKLSTTPSSSSRLSNSVNQESPPQPPQSPVKLSGWGRIKAHFTQYPEESALTLLGTAELLYHVASYGGFGITYMFPSIAPEPWNLMTKFAGHHINLFRPSFLGLESLPLDSPSIVALASSMTSATIGLPLMPFAALPLVPILGPRYARPLLKKIAEKPKPL
ncbi:hypothetical protein GQ42DRAFT_160015 [Ramicandelaber brevisporus]|nr:hypothetical protein GQ42DRAFT_160015 [Ramicandelaber brevisporus]